MQRPAGSDWLALTNDELPVGAIYEWLVLPSCGAVVVFSGTARDHAEGRVGVTELHYEAYETQVVARLRDIVSEMRNAWPALGRVALLHRIGPLAIGESSVVVGASSPHRPDAFDAARFGIDTLKATVPIWKKERWGDASGSGSGAAEGWALGAQHVTDVATAARRTVGASGD